MHGYAREPGREDDRSMPDRHPEPVRLDTHEMIQHVAPGVACTDDQHLSVPVVGQVSKPGRVSRLAAVAFQSRITRNMRHPVMSGREYHVIRDESAMIGLHAPALACLVDTLDVHPEFDRYAEAGGIVFEIVDDGIASGKGPVRGPMLST